ncbi:Zeaxanthin epoxidase chloroplastic [Bienertia sinuspersici]
MASTALYNSLTTSSTVLLRAHLPKSYSNDEVHQQVYNCNNYCYLKNKAYSYSGQNKNKGRCVKATVVAETDVAGKSPEKKLRVLVAGGGIGGLVFALAAKKKGFEVVVFEKDLSAIRGEGQYRGPIQIQSNALATLEAIDMEVAEKVMDAGCVTGDRINGLVDGVSGNW